MRKCILFDSSPDNKRHIYNDEINSGEIFDYIRQDPRHIKKFRFICDLLLIGHSNYQIYSKEEINHRTKGVTAMKFFPGQENDRIYCKEYETPDNTQIVIASELLIRKKQKELTHREISIIEKAGSYAYEIPEF